jgi:hypothetical protein
LSEKYLGMPMDVGTSVNDAFTYLKDQVWKKVQGWMEQCLSTGGKEVLIKAVAQAIPTYSMSSFKLLRGLCNTLMASRKTFGGEARKVNGEHARCRGMTCQSQSSWEVRVFKT